jgi:hypothetical protein
VRPRCWPLPGVVAFSDLHWMNRTPLVPCASKNRAAVICPAMARVPPCRWVCSCVLPDEVCHSANRCDKFAGSMASGSWCPVRPPPLTGDAFRLAPTVVSVRHWVGCAVSTRRHVRERSSGPGASCRHIYRLRSHPLRLPAARIGKGPAPRVPTAIGRRWRVPANGIDTEVADAIFLNTRQSRASGIPSTGRSSIAVVALPS